MGIFLLAVELDTPSVLMQEPSIGGFVSAEEHISDAAARLDAILAGCRETAAELERHDAREGTGLSPALASDDADRSSSPLSRKRARLTDGDQTVAAQHEDLKTESSLTADGVSTLDTTQGDNSTQAVDSPPRDGSGGSSDGSPSEAKKRKKHKKSKHGKDRKHRKHGSSSGSSSKRSGKKSADSPDKDTKPKVKKLSVGCDEY